MHRIYVTSYSSFQHDDDDAWIGEIARTIGKISRMKRHENQLSRIEVANRIGINPEFYARIERGQSLPSVHTLARLSVALDVMVDTLLGNLHEQQDPLVVRLEQPDWGPQDTEEFRRLVERMRKTTPSIRRLLYLLSLELE